MTKRLFVALDVYRDTTPPPAAINMAIDEALLELARVPSMRFYGWDSPALSFGYFGRFTDVAEHSANREIVRRWTGGGIVFHGEDLTYSLIIPSSEPVFSESSMSIYEKVHRALAEALTQTGQSAIVAGVSDPGPRSAAVRRAGISDAGYSCFANAVAADVMLNGRKVAGAAQRRTRAGLLQQGSIQDVDLGSDFAERFARELSHTCDKRTLPGAVQNRAQEIAARKYGTESWLRKR